MSGSAPLAHLRVLDLSRVLAGPWAGQVLADLGAEVIKIERPGEGDDTRSWGPPWLKDAAGRETRESAYYLACNRGKKSVTVDISRREGQDIVRALAARSDILLENFKVGALARYRLAYPDLRSLNPGLIYCSISGFGQDGPYRDRAGYDFMIQAMGGLMSITGEPDSAPGGGPLKVGVAIADLMTGMYAATGVLAALARRALTGRGEHLDLALLDVQVAMLANQAMNYLVSGTAPERLGNAHPNIVPYQAFRTRDGNIVLAVGNDRQFARFCEIAGQPALASDPRFATNAARVRHRAALVPRIAELMAGRRTAEWVAALEEAGVPCGPINTLDQVFADPQVRHRGLRIEAEHPEAGSVPLVASPLRFPGAPPRDCSPPPGLGQHTGEVLEELLGLAPERIRALRSDGVI
ncbi:MAG TPA: CaiB/BaiF CoA-transferase family protein [Burkholderiales bacterium]|nr:CaiB/BaiF CoA-transferase family protein [Burkholderiales bacterium]